MALSGAPLANPVDVSRLLDKGLAGNPNANALISLETSWTWQELSEDSARMAGNLLDLGLKPGDRAACLMPNRCAVLVFYLACLKAGLITTPINYRSSPNDIDQVLKASGTSLLLAHRERAADLAAAERARSLPFGLIGFGQGSLAGGRFGEFIENEPKTDSFPEPSPDAPAFLLFAQTSDGTRRGVVHGRRGLGWSLASVAAGYGFQPEDIYMTGTALSHYGGAVQGLAALACGSRVAISRNADAEEILPLLRAEKPSLAFMLPSSMVRLVRDHDTTAKDFSSLRYLACSGDQTPLSQVRDFEQHTGVTLHEHYGMAEVGPVTVQDTSANGSDEEMVTGAVGRLLPGFSAEIRSETGYLLPAGMPGKLWIKSPGIMLGYWDGQAAKPAETQEGWLDSAETMRADSTGTLILAGKKQQVCIYDAADTLPIEVEEVLAEHPSVTAAGVVGIHDLLHGETVLAFVTLDDEEQHPTEQELIAFARSRVGYKAPEQVVVVEAMPKGDSGAVDRKVLRQLAETGLSQDAPID